MMNRLTGWLKAARWHASVLHLLEMWAFFVPAWIVTRNPFAGAAAVVSWYWSRKRAETQAAVSPNDLEAVPFVGLFPWQWTWALQLDFYLPAAASIAAAALIR